MPYFRRMCRPVVTTEALLGFVGEHPFKPTPWNSLLPCGRELYDVAKAKKSTAGGLSGWAWNEIQALPAPRFSG